MLYFAFGSNMFAKRLQLRVPSASTVSIAVLQDYDLRFHKRSNIDGSGKCSVMKQFGRNVHGVLFDIDPDEKKLLDQVEGAGAGYHVVRIRITASGEPMHAFCYMASKSHIDDSLKPFRWYKRLVIAGAEQHGLPQEYIARLRRVPAKKDPDKKRRQKAENILNHISDDSVKKI